VILSDRDILKAINAGEIRCAPTIAVEQIRPTGIRLHLANRLLLPERAGEVVDVEGNSQSLYTKVGIPTGGFVLRRGAFVLGSSVEHISADPCIICYLDGRSTLARLGLMVHCGSVTFDHVQGAPRSVTFELVNLGPFDLRLHAGGGVGLLSFVRLSSPVGQPVGGQYDRQSGPTAPDLGYPNKES
jgi:dCTP deaminase